MEAKETAKIGIRVGVLAAHHSLIPEGEHSLFLNETFLDIMVDAGILFAPPARIIVIAGLIFIASCGVVHIREAEYSTTRPTLPIRSKP